MSCITPDSIKSPITTTWCPGCGDYLILNALQKALTELKLNEEDVVLTYGIGCAGNMADFNRAYGFHALHGRALPVAIGIKLANQNLKVIVIAGDGDAYGEGLGHLIAAARGNHDITLIVHDNGRYSLTTGQSSPTSHKGLKTKSTPTGLIDEPINPILIGLSAKATFVARGYSAKPPQMAELIKQAIQHPGFALIDILQLCPSFNKEMNHPWFASRIYDLDATYDSNDIGQAYAKAMEVDKFALGVIYQNKQSVAHHAQIPQLQKGSLLSQFPAKVDLQPSTAKMK